MKPGYNDIGLYDTSPIETDILCYQLIRHSWILTTLVCNDTIYSVPLMTL